MPNTRGTDRVTDSSAPPPTRTLTQQNVHSRLDVVNERAFDVGASRRALGIHLMAPFTDGKPRKYRYIASRSVSLAKAEMAFQGIPSVRVCW
jgi:hypothetical protein